MFRDVELGQGCKAPRRPQAVVITQGAEADLAFAELTVQVPLPAGQIVCPGSYVECIDHDLGGLIRRQVGLPRFHGQVDRSHAMTLRLSIDDQPDQDQAPVHGAAKS